MDTRASTSGVILKRDFGNISTPECQKYQDDLDAVKAKEMSFHDFITNLQAGNYSRPVSKTPRGDFCEQVFFSSQDAANINSLKDFEDNIAKLKTIRIRQVTGGGSFSSGTKARFNLSIPIKARFVAALAPTPAPAPPRLAFGAGKAWAWTPSPPAAPVTPVMEDMTISTLSMYYPSPLRIENVQHDAVLSLNDPSDPTTRTVILIPLKAGIGSASVDFFNKIAKHLTTVTNPDPVTGLYPETSIPTGNGWNIKDVFYLGSPGNDNIAKVTDAYYTWMGAGSYTRVEKSRTDEEIVYGWDPDGVQVRYFMLETPVSISTTDLSFLTRSLPPTPADQAIHRIPDPTTSGNPKISYKKAEGNAAKAGCGGVIRERMTNKGMGDVLSSLMTGGGAEDLLVGADGVPLSDALKGSCDPFAANAKKATTTAGAFTPAKMAAFFFNFLIIIALAVGVWLALYFVVTENYDDKLKSFAGDAGKVIGTLALQTTGRIKDTAYAARQSLPSLPSVSLPNVKLGSLLGRRKSMGADAVAPAAQ
jgi:hypothetical protein